MSRVRAPELRGQRWLGTGGQEVSLAGLRGRIVLLHFWTSGCVNCLHVLDELAVLQARFADVLVVVGVHSPKFAHEAEPDAVADAVERYDVRHPVLDDADLVTWDAYAARAWPTLVLVDHRGYVVAHLTGEGHADELAALVEQLAADAGGSLRQGSGTYVPASPSPTALRFPGKAVRLPGGTFLVSDTAHHQLVELADDLVTEQRRFGDGARGLVDGRRGARFAEPLGAVLLPTAVAERVGYDVVVADSANHALRGLRLGDGTVRTIAGTGAQLRTRIAVGSSAPELSTPWDVAWWDDRVLVAMAGTHQLWSFDPATGTAAVWAGTADEGMRDGPPADAFFAQPSGLAVSTAPDPTLWVADAETSALRSVVASPAVGAPVTTAVGHGLFEFGLRDGPAGDALLQHPLGVAVLPDGTVAIADTYNGSVRRYDPVARTVTTLARDLREPTDVLLDGDTLVVVESAAHRLVRLPLPGSAQRGAEATRPPIDVASTGLELRVEVTPPPGQHLDTRFGDPTRLTVSAVPAALLTAGGGTEPGLVRTLRLSADAPVDGVLHVDVVVAACDDGDGIFAACHRHRRSWTVPVHRTVSGAPILDLVLQLH